MRFLLVILHKLLLLALGVYWLGEYVLTQLREFLNGANRQSLQADKAYIEHHIRHLDKAPHHLAVILGHETPNPSALARLVLWIAAAGIDHVSIYDHKDQLAKVKDKIRAKVETAKEKSDQIIWAEDFNGTNKPIPHKNGYRRRLIVNFFGSLDAGKELTVNVCKELSLEFKKGLIEAISIEEVDKRLKTAFFGLPDPDLALYFGGVCCTFGLSPWHLRLTEFISLRTQATATPETFVRALYRFSKCEQRFGK